MVTRDFIKIPYNGHKRFHQNLLVYACKVHCMESVLINRTKNKHKHRGKLKILCDLEQGKSRQKNARSLTKPERSQEILKSWIDQFTTLVNYQDHSMVRGTKSRYHQDVFLCPLFEEGGAYIPLHMSLRTVVYNFASIKHTWAKGWLG